METTIPALLEDLYQGEEHLGSDGQRHRIDTKTRISRAQGEYLQQLALESGAERTLEVGMAYGFSTLFLLAAHAQRGRGLHTALDPFESRVWHGIGLKKVEQSGCERYFRFFEQTSIEALPALRRERESFDLVYIDGNHQFDAVIVDFHLSDPICKVGGHIVLDDMWMPAIQSATRFIERNLPYERVNQPIRNLLVLRKVGEDRRRWDHFVPFSEPALPTWLRRLGGRKPRR